MKLMLLKYLLLLVCWSSQTLSQDPADPDATTGDMDYEVLSDLFASPSPLQPGSAGSGSGVMMEIIEPTDPPDLLPNCSLPEAGSIRPRGLESLTFATIRARCHSLCLRSQSYAPTDIETFSGYPFWTLGFTSFLLSEDGRNGADCLNPINRNNCDLPTSCPLEFNQFLSCKFGCEANLAGAKGSRCHNQCRRNCGNELCGESSILFGCQSDRLPPSCYAHCDGMFTATTGYCQRGCEEGASIENLEFNSTDRLTDGQALHPLQPPIVTPIGNTSFVINVEETMPEFMNSDFFPIDAIQSIVGFVTVVLRVTGQNAQKFYVLEDSNEVRLGDFFACQTVNVSFAIATNRHGQLSNFSPEVTVEIFNSAGPTFPSQLSGGVEVLVEPDTRVDYFRQHIVTVSWRQPENIEDASEISVLLTGNPDVCGNTTAVLNATTTRHVFQAPQPSRFGDNAFPPVTQCSYILLITVLPVNQLGDPPFERVVNTGLYPVPSNDDLIMSCEAVPRGDIYNITVALEFTSAFTPAVIEGIAEITLIRNWVTEEGRLIITDGSSATLAPIRNISNHTSSTTAVPPLRESIHYSIWASLRYRADIPNIATLSSSEVAQTECFIRNAQFLAANIESAIISIGSLDHEPITSTQYNVRAAFTFVYEQPQNSVLEGFDVWLMSERAPEDTTSIRESLPQISKTQRSVVITQTISAEENVTRIALYLQIRARGSNQVSIWSDPVTSTSFLKSLINSDPSLQPEVSTLDMSVSTTVIASILTLLLVVIILIIVIIIVCIMKRRTKAFKAENIYDVIGDVPRRIIADEAEFERNRTDNCYEIVDDDEFIVSPDQVTYEIVHIYDVARHSKAIEYNSAESKSSSVLDGFDWALTKKLAFRDNVVKFMSDSNSPLYVNFTVSQLVNSGQTRPNGHIRSMGIIQVLATDQARTYETIPDEQGIAKLTATEPRETDQTYELMDVAHFVVPETDQSYERVPNVHNAQLVTTDSNKAYERVSNVDFTQLVATNPHETYERVPDVNMAQSDLNETDQTYKQVPSLNIALSVTTESSDNYDKVPNVDIAQLVATDASETYKRVPNMDIAQLVGTDPSETYEQVPSVDIAQLVGTDPSETYERVPSVDISQLVAIDSSETYERVPSVDISQLVATDSSETYERVPSVDISQLVAADSSETYKRVPKLDIAQLVVPIDPNETDEAYKRVQNTDIATVLDETYERVPDVDIAQLTTTDLSRQCGQAPYINVNEMQLLLAASNRRSILFADRTNSVYEQVPQVDVFQILATYSTEIKSISERTLMSVNLQDQT